MRLQITHSPCPLRQPRAPTAAALRRHRPAPPQRRVGRAGRCRLRRSRCARARARVEQHALEQWRQPARVHRCLRAAASFGLLSAGAGCCVSHPRARFASSPCLSSNASRNRVFSQRATGSRSRAHQGAAEVEFRRCRRGRGGGGAREREREPPAPPQSPARPQQGRARLAAAARGYVPTRVRSLRPEPRWRSVCPVHGLQHNHHQHNSRETPTPFVLFAQ